MNVSRDEVAMLARRRDAGAAAPIREGWKDGVLAVFIAGRPTNPLNGTLAHAHWSKRTRWANGWRERAGTRLLLLGGDRGGAPRVAATPWPAREAKRITFTVYGPSRFDDDNLRAVVKPVRDALKDMAVIDDDRESAGHAFHYWQAKPSRKIGAQHGIAITIQLRGGAR